MRNKWHTKTLFIQWWKYKWSYRYDHCVKCWTCNFKHKGRWLCLSCWDKERNKTPKGYILKKIIQIRYWVRNRISHWLNTQERKACWNKCYELTQEERKRRKPIYQKNYWKKNREIINLKNKIYRRRKKWLPCLIMMINWKERYFPFEGLWEKPKVYWSFKRNIWKEKQNEFEILRKYYSKK